MRLPAKLGLGTALYGAGIVLKPHRNQNLIFCRGGNFISETSSQLTAPSSGESANSRSLPADARGLVFLPPFQRNSRSSFTPIVPCLPEHLIGSTKFSPGARKSLAGIPGSHLIA